MESESRQLRAVLVLHPVLLRLPLEIYLPPRPQDLPGRVLLPLLPVLLRVVSLPVGVDPLVPVVSQEDVLWFPP